MTVRKELADVSILDDMFDEVSYVISVLQLTVKPVDLYSRSQEEGME